MKNNIQIAIDGPSGAGKSTLAKNIAVKYNFLYLDTGALYRTVGLFVYDNNIDLKDVKKICSDLKNIEIEIKYENNRQIMFLNGTDVTDAIRGNHISHYASAVSAIPKVREFLLEIQKNTADNFNIVMDGRDIGTVIMPDAQVKIYLNASVEDRAERRYLELREKGQDVSLNKIKAEIEERDRNDSSRDIAPAKPASDAVIFDNSGFTEQQTFDEVSKIIDSKLIDYEQ